MFFRTHSFFLVFDEVEISLTRHLAPVQKPETGSETQKVSGRFMIPGVHIARIRWDIFYHKRCQQARLIALSTGMWRHQLFKASWRAKYWFLGISVYIKNVHLLMFFRTHSFVLVFDEVEISLTRHLAPVQKPETGSETQKVSGRFMIPGVHIARIRWDIFDHKRCQQARLIALSNIMWTMECLHLNSFIIRIFWF